MISILKQVVICTLLIGSSTSFLTAQKYSLDRTGSMFLGVYGGFNYTFPKAKETYNVIVPMDPSAEVIEKDYGKKAQNSSSQFGLNFMYGISKHFSIAFQPGYYRYKFHYITNYTLIDTVESMNFAREMKHVQNTSYLTLPILVRWDFTQNRLSPFVQVGVIGDVLLNANKSIYYDNQIDGDVDIDKADGSTKKVDIKDHLQKFNFGLVGGVGVSYSTKYFLFGVECNYRYGFRKIINDRNRYADITGFATEYLDVFDDLKLSNLAVQFNFSMPINSLLKLNILRKSRY